MKSLDIRGEMYNVHPHAVRNQRHRGISDQDIELAISHPDSVSRHSVYDTIQYTKRIGRGRDGFVLRVAVAEERSPKLIVTVIVLGE